MRKLMWFAVGFGAACAFGAYCYVDWFMAAVWVSLSAAVVFGAVSAFVKPSRIAAVICLGIAAGFFWFHTYDTVHLSAARELDGQVVKQAVIIRDYSYETDYGVAADGEIMVEGKTYQVRLYLNDAVKLEPGNRVIGQFRFRYTTSGGLDEVLYHRSQGIFLMAYQKGNVVVERFWSMPLLGYIPMWQQKLTEVIDSAFPDDVSGFAKALFLGDSSGIDYETDTAFKISGIRHIIAVSGLHVSILFGLIYLLTARRRYLTAMLGIPVVLLFAAVAGFTPSITRAAIMQILMMLALLFEREYDPLTALSFSGLVMLVGNPLVIASVSFQLSFACMCGIFLLAEPIKNWLLERIRLGRRKNRVLKWIASSTGISLGAAVFTTPLTAVYFGTVSLMGPLTNLLTLWVITFVFYGILLVCLLGLLGMGAASWIAGVIAWPMRYVLAVSKLLAAFPLAAVYTQSRYIVAWLVFAYILLLAYMLMKEKPALVFSGLVVLMLCGCLAMSWLEPLLDSYRMTVLDVGQGQAILLQSSGKTYLVDCGGDYDEEAADITAQTLLSQGISRLDGIIVTHYDRDHTGGLEYLLTRISTDLLLLPDIEDENGVGQKLTELVGANAVLVREDMVLSYDDTTLTVYAPEAYHLGNESCICVLFQVGKCDILITGDRGEAGERLLMHSHDLPQVDVLVVGHHGSKYSTGEDLLQTVQPAYAFISVGADNSYGHPALELLQRLMEFGCIIYRTDENGTIVYRG